MNLDKAILLCISTIGFSLIIAALLNSAGLFTYRVINVQCAGCKTFLLLVIEILSSRRALLASIIDKGKSIFFAA